MVLARFTRNNLHALSQKLQALPETLHDTLTALHETSENLTLFGVVYVQKGLIIPYTVTFDL